MLCLKRVMYLKYVSNYVLHVSDLLWEIDSEVCAVKLHLLSCILCIITIHTSPSGSFSYFLKNIESILNSIYGNSIHLIISGDLNINYLNDNYTKQLLDSLLASYCLYSIVQFPTRILNNSSTAVNNIFINKFKKDNFIAYPWLIDYLTWCPDYYNI